jgi:hypothetical protein
MELLGVAKDFVNAKNLSVCMSVKDIPKACLINSSCPVTL